MVPTVWFESAADLLARGDPGPTPFLVEDLIVDGSVAALVGAPKGGKTFVLLDVAIAVVAGEPALGRFGVARPGPVLLILEESGRAALHRRLDKLVRGRAMKPEQLAEFYFAANKRVRLDDDEWRQRLREVALMRDELGQPKWRLIAFDPLARVKGLVDENVQREIGPVLDFLRELRDASGATVAYVHHTPHDGTRHRGSSDLEAYWETKLTLVKHEGQRELQAEHREAEAIGPFRLSFGFDATTNTLKLRAAASELEERVREYLDVHPTASANEVDAAVPGNRKQVLDLVRRIREGGSGSLEPPGTTSVGSDSDGGSTRGAYRAPGTTPADLGTEAVPDRQNHTETTNCDHREQWLDRKGDWHCIHCDPPESVHDVVEIADAPPAPPSLGTFDDNQLDIFEAIELAQHDSGPADGSQEPA